MALIACPECKGKVSDRAAACPHCGYPVREGARAEGDEETLSTLSPALFGGNVFTHILMVLLSLVVVGLFVYLWEWIRCRATRLVITTHRTTLETGIISRRTNEVRHRDIRNVAVSQGAFDRLFNVGLLELSSAGQSDVEIAIKGIRDPQGTADLIRRHR